MTELRKALERPVAGLVFDENRKNAVREKAFTAKRGGSALRRGAAVALVCTVLCVTAVAAGPSLWQYIQARQGPFAGLAQTVEGAVCTSGGIEIQVLSALADDVRGEVYFTVRDVEGDRLDSQLTLHCGADSDLAGRLVEYDSESRTALFAAGLSYYRPQTEGAVGLGTTGGAVPDTLHLAVERLTTRQGELDAGASCAGVTAALLDSLVCTPSSRQRNNLHFTHENPSCIPYGAGCYAASRRSWTSIGVRTPRPRWRRWKL